MLHCCSIMTVIRVDIYILWELHMQPQHQKVETQCVQVQPQLRRGSFVGPTGSAVSLKFVFSQSKRAPFDLKWCSVGLRCPLQA